VAAGPERKIGNCRLVGADVADSGLLIGLITVSDWQLRLTEFLVEYVAGQ